MQTNEKTRRSTRFLKNKNEHNDLQNENLKATKNLQVENSYDGDSNEDDVDENENYGTGNNEEDEDGYVAKKQDKRG